MKLQLPVGSTSVILTVFIQDKTQTDGRGLAGLTNASGMVGGYVRMGGTGVALAVDEDVTTEGTYQAPSTAAHARIGTPANMRSGTYELHFHNDLFAAGARSVTITLGAGGNMAELPIEVQLVAVNLNDGVRAGLTALPNAAADAAGGLPISDAGGLDLDTLIGRLDAAVSTRLASSGYTAPLDAAATRAALGLAAATLDDQLAAIAAFIDTEVALILTRIGVPAGASLSADIAAVQVLAAFLKKVQRGRKYFVTITGATHLHVTDPDAADDALEPTVAGTLILDQIVKDKDGDPAVIQGMGPAKTDASAV